MRHGSKLGEARLLVAKDDETPFRLLLVLMALSVAATTIGVLLFSVIHLT